jgi:hypothetical protein
MSIRVGAKVSPLVMYNVGCVYTTHVADTCLLQLLVFSCISVLCLCLLRSHVCISTSLSLRPVYRLCPCWCNVLHSDLPKHSALHQLSDHLQLLLFKYCFCMPRPSGQHINHLFIVNCCFVILVLIWGSPPPLNHVTTMAVHCAWHYM